MADTASSYETLIAAIDTRISALVAAQEVNYRIGNISVDASDKLDQLIKLREKVVEWARSLPAETVVTMQTMISAFGEDITQYVHEGL